MLNIDLAVEASVLLLPALPGAKTLVTARHGVSLRAAIEFVMCALSAQDRARAVIRTRHRCLYAAEIEALYELEGLDGCGREEDWREAG